MSRKQKLKKMGRKISKKKLRELLASVKVIKNKYPQPATILPFEFCPKCGCQEINRTGNMVAPPEVYDKAFCARCGFLVAMADNSPYYHCLESQDYLIE